LIVTIQKQVIKTIITYEHKNKQFKRINKHSNEKRKTRVFIFSRQFKIGQLMNYPAASNGVSIRNKFYILAASGGELYPKRLKPFSEVKKQGKPLFSVLVAMILSRLGGQSIYAMQQTGQLGMDDNTMYR
jgi:hypothetical protein